MENKFYLKQYFRAETGLFFYFWKCCMNPLVLILFLAAMPVLFCSCADNEKNEERNAAVKNTSGLTKN
jgi:hypothetical protein